MKGWRYNSLVCKGAHVYSYKDLYATGTSVCRCCVRRLRVSFPRLFAFSSKSDSRGRIKYGIFQGEVPHVHLIHRDGYIVQQSKAKLPRARRVLARQPWVFLGKHRILFYYFYLFFLCYFAGTRKNTRFQLFIHIQKASLLPIPWRKLNENENFPRKFRYFVAKLSRSLQSHSAPRCHRRACAWHRRNSRWHARNFSSPDSVLFYLTLHIIPPKC